MSAKARAAALVISLAATAAAAAPAAASDREGTTLPISVSTSGGIPNGPSTNAVISGDRRYARVIAFESTASDLVPNDVDGVKDVFAILRGAPIDNEGSMWNAGRTVLVSRTYNGQPANGPSYSAALNGAFRHRASCVGFLSAASNLVRGDTNNKVDAFVESPVGSTPKRVSLPGGHQSHDDATAVAVSGDCKRIAFVVGGKLYVRSRGKARRVRVAGAVSDPSFSTGNGTDLVFAASGGSYLSRGATRKPKLVAPGGTNPAYNDLKRRVITYEISAGGHTQVGFRTLGGRPQIASADNGTPGDGDSIDPVIGNSGYYITFQSAAGNLGTNAGGATRDYNDEPDTYLYSGVRKITLVESDEFHGEPLPDGGDDPSMSYYANYIVFDSAAPMDDLAAPHQIFMRYLGGI